MGSNLEHIDENKFKKGRVGVRLLLFFGVIVLFCFSEDLVAERKIKYLLALLSSGVAFVVYYLTMAPTVSFWDCGEFVAVANILGIPHPPGTPFFVVMSRAAIVLFGFIPEIAARVNMLSVLGSAGMVFVCFLITWETLTYYFNSKDDSEMNLTWIKSIGSLVGAFLVTTADTIWFNAVEAEVYSMSMLVMCLQIWLAIKWVQHRHSDFGDRLLVLICYIMFMGVGITLTSFMVVPMIFLFLAFVDQRFRSVASWPLWVTGILTYSIVWKFEYFIVFTLGAIVFAAVGLFQSKEGSAEKHMFRLSFWFAVVAIIGFSNHAYVPIRALAPVAINENIPTIAEKDLFNPTKWTAFNNYITRKQYGSESMFKRATHRRALLTSQFLTFPHIGLGGYQLAQWTPFKVGAVSHLGEGQFAVSAEENQGLKRLGMTFNTQMVLFGKNIPIQFGWFLLMNGTLAYIIWRLYKTNKSLAVLLGGAFFLGTFFLAYYLNFADGLSSDRVPFEQWVQGGKQGPYPYIYHEVRERDYFYTPGFVIMSVIFGLGAAMFLQSLYRNNRQKWVKIAGVSLASVSLAFPLASNFQDHSRANNWIAWDYAYNLLQSCEPNSILFTNGDNDTFPLWFMQEVALIRKDVRVVNLSLGNTDWYVRQIEQIAPKFQLGMFLKEAVKQVGDIDPIPQKKEYANQMKAELPKIEAAVTAQVQKVAALQVSQPNSAELKQQQQLLAQMRADWQMFVSYVTWDAKDESPWLKVQDMLVVDLVRANPQAPIHFASTVGPENFIGLDQFMKMEGMVYTLGRERTVPVPQDSVINMERTEKLVNTVFQYRGVGDGTTYVNSETQRLLYNYNAIYIRLAMQLRVQIGQARMTGNMAQVDASLLKGMSYIEKGMKQFPDEWRNYVIAAELYQMAGKVDKAKEILIQGGNVVSPWNKEPIEQKLQELAQASMPQAQQPQAQGVPMMAPQGQ